MIGGFYETADWRFHLNLQLRSPWLKLGTLSHFVDTLSSKLAAPGDRQVRRATRNQRDCSAEGHCRCTVLNGGRLQNRYHLMHE